MPTFSVKTDEESSWWDDNRGAIVFWSWASAIILFGATPYVWGWISIIKTIF